MLNNVKELTQRNMDTNIISQKTVKLSQLETQYNTFLQPECWDYQLCHLAKVYVSRLHSIHWGIRLNGSKAIITKAKWTVKYHIASCQTNSKAGYKLRNCSGCKQLCVACNQMTNIRGEVGTSDRSCKFICHWKKYGSHKLPYLNTLNKSELIA